MRFALVAALLAGAPLAGQAQDHLGKTLEEWRNDLRSSESIDRLLAIRSIGEMALAQREGAAEALFGNFEHPDGSVRYWAAVAAVHLPGPHAERTALLKPLLTDQVPEVRVQAARALVGTSEEPEALRTLAELLSHSNRGVRLQAAHAADALGAKAGPLAEELRTAAEDEFDYVQRVARHALWTLGGRSCPYRACE